MAKRFTDTGKWDRMWFRQLPVKAKLAWLYLVDNCDHCGVWQEDFGLMSFQTAVEVAKGEFDSWFGDKVKRIDKDKYFVPSFIEYQYGELRDQSAIHRSVINGLRRHGLDIDFKCGLSDRPSAVAARLSQKMKDEVFAEDKFTCTYCGDHGESVVLVVDHIVPKIKGGDNNPENLTTACIACNSRKSDWDVSRFIGSLGESAKIANRLNSKLMTLFKGLNSPKDKEEDKDKNKEEDKEGGCGGKISQPAPVVTSAPANPELASQIEEAGEVFRETLRHFKQGRTLLPSEKFAIGRAIQAHGLTAVIFALKGARFEPKTPGKYDPGDWVDLSRYLDVKNFKRMLGYGVKHASAPAAEVAS